MDVIVLLHDDVTIKTFIKILLFNATSFGGDKRTQIRRKSFQNRYKFTKRSGIVSKRLEYYLAHMNTYDIKKRDQFSLNCFARRKFCQIFYWVWRFYPLHKQTVTSSWSRAIACVVLYNCWTLVWGSMSPTHSLYCKLCKLGKGSCCICFLVHSTASACVYWPINYSHQSLTPNKTFLVYLTTHKL